MNNKRVNFLWLIILNLVVPSTIFSQNLSRVSPEEVGMSSGRLEHLTNTFEQYVDDGNLSGAVILVARKGQISYVNAFGKSNLENNVTMKDDAIFRIASQTKAIVSVGVMMLQEEGKLLITDAVGDYLPAFNETTVAIAKEGGEDGEFEIVKANRKITIRDLLTHSAGIGYGYGPAGEVWKEAGIQGWYFADRSEPIQETINRMAKLPMEAQPGEKFVYGYNTDILGALIEVVSGQPLDQYLKERIFHPLGMNDTHFYLPQEKANRLAVVYSTTDEGLKKAPIEGTMVSQGAYLNGPRRSFSGGAGLLSTAYDYTKFLQMMLNEGEFNGHRLLSPKTVELMTVDHLDSIENPWTNGTGFGLGFSVVENLGHRGLLGSEGEYGWGGAYHSTYWVDPAEELIVVYFTQLIPANGIDDHAKLRALVYQAITKSFED